MQSNPNSGKKPRKVLHTSVTKVGKQPIAPGLHPLTPLSRSYSQVLRQKAVSRGISTHDLEWYQRQRQIAAQEEQDQRDENQQAIATADLVPTVFVTTAETPQSLQSYAPTDPRANPIVSAGPGATGGFLPAPPV